MGTTLRAISGKMSVKENRCAWGEIFVACMSGKTSTTVTRHLSDHCLDEAREGGLKVTHENMVATVVLEQVPQTTFDWSGAK